MRTDAARARGVLVAMNEHLSGRPRRARYREALICQELRRLREDARTARAGASRSIAARTLTAPDPVSAYRTNDSQRPYSSPEQSAN